MKEIDYNKINYGFSLLKMLLAFEVLLAHFANWDEYNPVLVWPFRELVSLAVPCFIILSFYLMCNSFLSRNEDRSKTRLIKLLVPQIGWTVIYYVVYQFLDILFSTGLTIGITDFFWQLFTGHSRNLNPSMWYQIDIIAITLLFYLVFRLLKKDKHAYLFLVVLTVFCYCLQYSGINRAMFGNLRFELKYPLGRIAETIPLSFIGFSLKYFDVFEKLKKVRYVAMTLCVVLFFVGYNIPWIILKDFGYAGFCKPWLAICIITFAYLTPLECLSKRVKRAILKATDFSLGIYCVHRLINTLLLTFIPNMSLHSFERCVLLYFLCYFTCLLINLIPSKYFKQLVK